MTVTVNNAEAGVNLVCVWIAHVLLRTSDVFFSLLPHFAGWEGHDQTGAGGGQAARGEVVRGSVGQLF